MAHDVTINIEEKNKIRYVTRVGYQGFDQTPLLLVYEEEWYQGKVEYARVLYEYPERKEEEFPGLEQTKRLFDFAVKVYGDQRIYNTLLEYLNKSYLTKEERKELNSITRL